MNQQRADLFGRLGEDAGGEAVDEQGAVGFALGFVHGGVGAGVDQDLRLMFQHEFA
ncbi:MAG: hypothetical protein BWX84_03183 [Verrucomicrobia bacterium ADurb.Bin118]|nr:MAG: hypothetical protein BWX84_03183 [Verrucomicrobia bacterium ADurb.Bin118]